MLLPLYGEIKIMQFKDMSSIFEFMAISWPASKQTPEQEPFTRNVNGRCATSPGHKTAPQIPVFDRRIPNFPCTSLILVKEQLQIAWKQ